MIALLLCALNVAPIVYNNDGGDMLVYPDELPATEDAFVARRLEYSAETRIETISYCPESSGFGQFTCRKAGSPLTNACPVTGRAVHNATPQFLAMGTDSLEMAARFARKTGRRIHVSIRMNDTHDAKGTREEPSPLFSAFKRAHPECLFGTPEEKPSYGNWSAVDYACPEVRTEVCRFVGEFVSNYDIDGVEYDFNRHAQLFRSVAAGGKASREELASLTRMMRELRKITGSKTVAVRTPDSVGYCRDIGIDIVRWMKDGLIDVWIAGGYFQLEPWEGNARLAHDHGVRFYASLDESRIEKRARRAERPYLYGRDRFETYYARYAAAMAQGCDGVYLFNCERGELKHLGGIDPRETAGLEKFFFATERGSGGYRPRQYLARGDRYRKLINVDPNIPLVCDCANVMVPVFVAADPVKDDMRVRVEALASESAGTNAVLTVAGREYKSKGFDGVFAFDVDPMQVAADAENRFELAFPDAQGSFELRDFVVRILKRQDWLAKARDEFSEHRFGIFIHWGLYANYAQGEWYLEKGEINEADYARMKDGFYPSKFDAREWARIFKNAGARYVTITSRHHDGFSLWPTKVDDGYNIAETPFKRDVLGELASACREEGILLNFYYSLMDWHRPDYPTGRHPKARSTILNRAENYEQYKRFMMAQIAELIDSYQPGLIWFDGEWDHWNGDRYSLKRKEIAPRLDWQFDDLYDLIHGRHVLVGNNNHQPMREKEDIQFFERDLPGQNETGFSPGQPVSGDRPKEQCDVLQLKAWGYRIGEREFRTPQEVVRMIVRCAAKDASLLMNVGPTGSGELPPQVVQTLEGVGAWMRQYGHAIYGTRGGGISENGKVCRTRKAGRTYRITLPDGAQDYPVVEEENE